MVISRRNALKVLALPCLAGFGATGCGSASQTVRVAVVWSGSELEQFERVMSAFRDIYGYGYSILSMGDDTTAFLNNEVTAAAQPDVALIPQPGLIRAFIPRPGLPPARQLAPVGWPPKDAPTWRSLLQGAGDGQQYGVWFKAAYESMVWHTDDLPTPAGGWDWDRWVWYCLRRAQAGHPPLAIGAADGWVLVGWFSNVLLSIDPPTYRQLVTEYRTGRKGTGGLTWDNRSVWQALARLADLWRIEGLFPGGPERALVTQFDQAVLDVYAYGQADMVVGSDFFWPIITTYTSFPTHRVRWFPFPSKPPGRTPIIVGGDAAVLFQRSAANHAAMKLIEWLAKPEAASIWAQAGGFLSINRQVSEADYPYKWDMHPAKLISSVQQGSPDGGPATFSLADQLTGLLGGGDGEGTWKIFTDFFTEVAVRRSPVRGAIETVIKALNGGLGGS